MTKIEIFDTMLEEVCRACNVQCESVINGMKYQPVVDARCLMVQYLRRLGFSNDEIAMTILRKQKGDMNYCPDMDAIKKKAKGINKTFMAYSERCLQSVMFRIISKGLSEFCRTTFEDYPY